MSAPIRAAATVILWRMGAAGLPEVLMGQRGHGAVFMPSKYVFPGGAVDAADANCAADAAADAAAALGAQALHRLGLDCEGDAPSAATLLCTARRELAEETGLCLPPRAPLAFVFRATTPPGSPRRFDARFFLADARSVQGGSLDDFSGASDELSHLHWIGLDEARGLDLPFITEIVLAEVAAILRGEVQPGVPFFDNSGKVPRFRRLV